MNRLAWNTSVEALFKGRKNKTLERLQCSGLLTLEDLLWILPLRIEKLPPVSKFKNAQEGRFFKGVGKILSIRSTPSFKARGKKGVRLNNANIIAQDFLSSDIINLKIFNLYPNKINQLKNTKNILFTGKISSYKNQHQIINPIIEPFEEQSLKNFPLGITRKIELQIHYPTFNKIAPTYVKNLFTKIPNYLWDEISEYLPDKTIKYRDMASLSEAFRVLHGKIPPEEWSLDREKKAKDRLIYEEFFKEQLKIKSRKQLITNNTGIKHLISTKLLNQIYSLFPYQLTQDQKTVILEMAQALSSHKQMMRLLQGDVGSGKTTIALGSAIMAIENGYQVAVMCPTESLALQHFLNFKEILTPLSYNIEILLGSTKRKEKERILFDLKKGKINLTIGTHSLIQENVIFKNLSLAIIDEQHKFGVDQRLKLVNKNKGTHCLIMTATPIPRSLGLTQYGDLDISTIKTMPNNRKGIKTRIIEPYNFKNFLNFLNTRLSLREQAYIVVPAILENENQDITNLETVLEKFKKKFPNFKIVGLHGQLKPHEKSQAFVDFKNHNIDILISTSVIEVGINVPNASIMAIMNPDRFGLSSLHQLRGRVGRGNKPGFCFLINDKKISATSMERLKVIERTCDGFKIAEEDLRIRGEGDIFGTHQSGITQTKTLANIITHQDALIAAKEDVDELLHQSNPRVMNLLERFKNDIHLTQTI